MVNGIGLNKDTGTYFRVARSLDLSAIPAVQSPLYYLYLMLFKWIGVDPLFSSKLLNLICSFSFPLVMGLLLRNVIKRDKYAFVIVCLTLTNYALYTALLVAKTEPLYLLFQTITLLGLINYSLRLEKMTYLLLAVVSCSFALSTRYVGVSLVAAMFFALILNSDETFIRRVSTALGSCTFAIIPLFVYLFINYIRADSAVGDTIRTAYLPPENIPIFLQTMGTHVIPYKVYALLPESLLYSFCAGVFTVPLILAIVIKPFRKYSILSIYCVLFLLVTVLSVVFKDHQIILGQRIMTPFLVCWTLLVNILAVDLIFKSQSKTVVAFVVLFISIPLATNGLRISKMAIVNHQNGIEYASKKWRNSDSVPFVAEVAKSFDVYANTQTPLIIYHNKMISLYPKKMEQNTRSVNHDFETRMANIGLESKEGNSLFAVFRLEHPNDHEFPYYYPNVIEIQQLARVEKIAEVEDLTILGSAEQYPELRRIAESMGVEIEPCRKGTEWSQ